MNPYSNNSHNEMKILHKQQQPQINLTNNIIESTTSTNIKGNKLKKSKSQNEILQASVVDKGK